MFSALRSLTILAFVAAASVGCGGAPSDQPELASVSGTVTKDGQPLANAIVTFTPEKGRQSTGETDSSGYYSLMYTIDAEGAVPGKHAVVVSSVDDEDYESGNSGESEDSEPVQAEPLEVTVKAGSNTIDIPL